MTKTIMSINDTPEFTLKQKLSEIQMVFKAEKSKFNSFGKYKYRSAEDILEALKPINLKFKVYFTINEQLINSNPPIINSVATIWDTESSDSIDCTAVVGIDLESKGMSKPQQFGTASSYAKKYALGNLLLIDDTKDDDALHTGPKNTEAKPKPVLLTGTDEYSKALDYMKGGGDISKVENKYALTENIKQALLTN